MPLPFGLGPSIGAARISEKEIAPIARTRLEKIMMPVVAGTSKFASNAIGAAASIADFASFGNFPKSWSNAMRSSAVEAQQTGDYLSRSGASQSGYGKAVRTGYDLLPFALNPGAGGTAMQVGLSGGGASARNEPVAPAVALELAETLVRPLRNPMTNKLIGELTTSSTVNEP
jgi:hypothetical protein